jgi:hypothetical protein
LFSSSQRQPAAHHSCNVFVSSPSRAAAATISEVHSPILIHVKVIGEHEVHPICLSADGMRNTSLWTHDKQPKVSISDVEVTVCIKLEPKWPSTDVLILQGSRLPIAHTGPVQKKISAAEK